MDGDVDQKPAKKPYTTPKLRTFSLTDDEVAKLRASKDPIALLLEMKPQLTQSN